MLRRAEPSDLPALAALIAAHPMVLLAQDAAGLAALMQDDGNRVLVWDRAGLAGFAVVETLYPQVVYLTNFAVTNAGRGEGRALLAAVLDLAFAEMGAHRLFCDIAFDNQAALGLFGRMGLVREGTMRECWLRPDGKWADCHAFSMLRHEWRNGTEPSVSGSK